MLQTCILSQEFWIEVKLSLTLNHTTLHAVFMRSDGLSCALACKLV